ncbi:DNA-binding MarR family transcriptional regulator [Caulobacter ginsengisoli]|uniref:DNA-binding MarR family transcriptional regulator n=1 Tax=Caulobacter ginsengisoli TaxID=400775 RepID=A0ABU0IPC7_9CAUL|nr:MarR family transcriptional regulator [Caulobacter ginsengisoli]MDQ0463246.1 DNA-binding MarR family transcriptional regulator [Caulobacter ginsengisoli]
MNDITSLIDRIPRLFHLLKALGDKLHADLGVTTSMRGVMVSLARDGERTVPELARERPVSRQHIQTVVDALTAAGLAMSRPNPQHRRSVLIVLTAEGRRLFETMQARETELFRSAHPADPADIAAAHRVFDALETDLAAHLRPGELIDG